LGNLIDVIDVNISFFPIRHFQSRKEWAVVFGNLLRREINSKKPVVDYMERNKQLLESMTAGYEGSPEVATACGLMLRHCIEHESLAKQLLYANNFRKFFDYVESGGFDVASDALTTFKASASSSF
jgi:calcium binding protein 39